MFDPIPLPEERAARTAAIEDRVAVLAGQLNAIQAELVDLMAIVVTEGIAADAGLAPQKWLAWRAGMATARAKAVTDVAARREELPTAIELLREGSLTVDQAAAVARHVPAAFEAEGTELARKLPVTAAAHHLSRVGWEVPKPAEAAAPIEEHASIGTDDRGVARMSATLAPDHGAVVATALRAAREDRYRQLKAEAEEGARVLVTTADALVVLAECYLRTREAAVPGTDRYRVHLHHEVGSGGAGVTSVHGGAALPSELARLHTCDGSMRSILEVGGRSVGICKAARIVPEWLRRLVEHRDGGCRVPGCGAKAALQIHHIEHWEDGGLTELFNLLTLCARHHRMHHDGLLGITGNPELPDEHPDGLRFTDRWGRPMVRSPEAVPSAADPVAEPPAAPEVAPYPPPYRERLDPWAVVFNTPPPPRPAPPNHYGEPLAPTG